MAISSQAVLKQLEYEVRAGDRPARDAAVRKLAGFGSVPPELARLIAELAEAGQVGDAAFYKVCESTGAPALLDVLRRRLYRRQARPGASPAGSQIELLGCAAKFFIQEVEKDLERLLTAPGVDVATRCQAVRLLGEWGTVQARQPLRALLYQLEADQRARRDARAGMGMGAGGEAWALGRVCNEALAALARRFP